jgi:hypothetical protein
MQPMELAEVLTLGRSSGSAADSSLVRWPDAGISVGVIVPRSTDFNLLQDIFDTFREVFRKVSRVPEFCIRPTSSSDRDNSVLGAHRIPNCHSSPTDIDLIFDTSDITILEDTDAVQLPSKKDAQLLRQFWMQVRKMQAAAPDTGRCDFGVATNAMATRIIGAAVFIRAPNAKAIHRPKLTECASELAAKALGTLRVPSSGDIQGRISLDLLELLYSTEFSSGESKISVFNKLMSVK